MKQRVVYLSLLVILASVFTGCAKATISYNSQSNQNTTQYETQYGNQFIEAITPTGISRMASVAVSFVYEPKIPMGEAISLSPAQKGIWEFEGNTARFTPEKPYKANSTFALKVDCGKLFGTGESEIYTHDFHVSAPKYDIAFDEIRYDDNSQTYVVSGNITTDIPVAQAEIEKTLKAKLSNKNKNITWQKSDKDNVWNFSVENVNAPAKNTKLSFAWTAKALGMTSAQAKLAAGSKLIEIPAKTLFNILDVNTTKENTILVSFSKTLDKTQNPASFIRLLDNNGKVISNYNTSIRGNVLSIFSDNNFQAVSSVSVEQGLKSSDGIYLAAASKVTLSENWEKPAVRFTNDNVILPTSQGTVFPIETRNLTGVLVQVYSIPDKNMPFFLQDSELDEKNRLYRVGEPVWEKKVNFKWDDAMQNKYITNGLDLSALTKKYPNGMFHIRVTYRPDQIKYKCNRNHPSFKNLPAVPDTIEPYKVPNERSSWDYWEGRNSNRDSYWSYNDDPCHPAYYMPGYNSACVISRNILVSDLGLMVKRDNTDKLFVTVADLKTGKPVSNAQVELRSFVGTLVNSAKTDKDGNAIFKSSNKAFVVTATQGNQTSFLKLTAKTGLSTSHFEIGGEKSTNGVKGFIYGERGVWRPGNTLYLTFVLQDLQKSLPKDIPVTFELVDPLGRIADTQVLTESVNGFYPIQTKTEPNATTGLWTGRVTIGGKSWTKYLSIEAVVPNHLSVELEAEGDYLKSDSNKFTISGAWLHGAPTPSYRTDVSVAFTSLATTFDGYSEYSFMNDSNSVDPSRETIFSGFLGSDSKAIFVQQLNAGNNLPGKLKANFITRVYEPSGGFSTQSKSMIYSPFERYVGIKLPKGDAARNMLLTDTDHTVDVVLLDEDGKPVSSTNVTYTVYQIEWKWWWEKDAYTSATHVSSRYYNKVASGSVPVSNGKGSFKFQVKYPDWGRYFVEVKDGNNGHSAGKVVYIDWPGWAGRAQEGGTGSSAMVPLTTSKKSYTVGETAEISFTSNAAATAYVCVEKGGTIIKQQLINTVKGTNVYKLPLTKEMSPNVYIHLSLVQPHMQTANSLPIRLYGVVPVMVDNPATRLEPVITSVDSFEPSKKATISVSEKSGKAMTYTIAVVDEGLLGLTNYHSPDLRKEFYKKEASELENWDIYRYVMNAYSGKLETILAIGGSEEIDNNAVNDENRFTPVVKFFGPFTLAAGETKATSFQMPYYVGAVRTMVIAGQDGAYGVAEKTQTVKAPLMTIATVPRTIGSNEGIIIPVNVFNGDDFEKKVTVTLNTVGAVTSSKSKSLTLKANETITVEFPFATTVPGKVIMEATAKSENYTAKSTVPVMIQSRGIPVTYKKQFEVKAGTSQAISVASPGEKGSEKLTMELSPFPQIDLSSRLSYLTGYPHGCIEQITSGGFPQLFVPSYVKMGSDQIERIKDNVKSVFDRYKTYQTSSGAMGYWPGSSYPHTWGTCYSSHFLLEARNQGYEIPESILEAELKWLSDTAADWTQNHPNESASVQAYRLFVLALAGQADMSAMNRLNADAANLNNDTLLLLAAAYANASRKDIAQSLLRKYKASNGFYRYNNRDFSSDIRTNAMYIYACVQADMTSQIPQNAKKVAEILSSDRWLSTQEAAWSLYALLPYYSQQKVANAVYTISANGVDKSGTIENSSVIEVLSAKAGEKTQTAKITNTGKAHLYGTLTCSGMSVAGTERTQNENIRMQVNGLNNLRTIKAGDDITITVTISNESGKDIDNLALTIPVPTCFEFRNERVGNEDYKVDSRGNEYRDDAYTYQDIRDDAIYTYFDLKRNRSVTYTFTATVAYKGNFYVPAIHCEAMYDDSIVAVKPGQFVQMK